ncbi:MAG: hypothetical protein HFH26_12570 [Clostridiaceae bacterium]|nr:hypothetical protein [Clostridiaceae bacterium]
MTFKDCIATDIHDVFLNENEFSERRTVVYDGKTYENILVSLQDFEEADRPRVSASGSGRGGSDHAQGLRQNTFLLYCARKDLDGRKPIPPKTIKISISADSSRFHEYYIVAASCEMGMLQIELRAVKSNG